MGSSHATANHSESSSSTSDNTILLWLVKNGPRWARIPAIVATLVITIVPTLLLVGNSLTKWRQAAAEKPANTQLQLAAAGDLSARGALVKTTLEKPNLGDDDKKFLGKQFEEIEHELWHLNNPNDNVAWTTFAKKSTNDYFGFKLFPSDQCLVVARVENGNASSQWLRDPNRPNAPLVATGGVAPKPTALPRVATSPLLRSALLELPDRLGPYLHGQVGTAVADLAQLQDSPTELRPVQGYCLAQHPGNFQFWWGAPINQCQQPIFRRWADGCAHTQVYDRCQNVWGPVVWQFCAANHF
jgi:hypothetical protein